MEIFAAPIGAIIMGIVVALLTRNKREDKHEQDCNTGDNQRPADPN